MHKREIDLISAEFPEALGDRLERALHIGLEHEVQRRRLATLNLAEDVLELDTSLHAGIGALITDLAMVSARLADRPSDPLVGRGAELVSGSGHRRQAEHLDRCRRSS